MKRRCTYYLCSCRSIHMYIPVRDTSILHRLIALFLSVKGRRFEKGEREKELNRRREKRERTREVPRASDQI